MHKAGFVVPGYRYVTFGNVSAATRNRPVALRIGERSLLHSNSWKVIAIMTTWCQ